MSERRRAILRALRELQDPTSPDAERRRLDARNRILEATLDLTLAHGWQNLTMEAIAARAKVGKQTIYRWWSSKGAVLFDAVVADGFSWPGFPDTGDFQQDLESALGNLVIQFSEPSFDRLMRAILAGAQQDEYLAEKLDGLLSAAPLAALTDRIESGQETDQVDGSVDAVTLAELAYGAVFRRWLVGTGKLDREFAAALAAAVLRITAPVESLSSRGRGR